MTIQIPLEQQQRPHYFPLITMCAQMEQCFDPGSMQLCCVSDQKKAKTSTSFSWMSFQSGYKSQKSKSSESGRRSRSPEHAVAKGCSNVAHVCMARK